MLALAAFTYWLKTNVGLERMAAAAAFFQKGGPERDVAAANLGRGEIEGAEGGVETARFETVGVAVAGLDAFIRAGTDVLGPFHEHGGVHEQFGDFGESFGETVVKREVDEIMMGGRGCLVFVHCCCFLGSHLQQSVPGGHHNPGWGRRAAGQADDSATLHRLPDRRTRASQLLQTKIYTTFRRGTGRFLTTGFPSCLGRSRTAGYALTQLPINPK